jgi:tetratricopeptide (TPR) repeat protein
LDVKVDRNMVGQALSPLLGAMDKAEGISPDDARHEKMIDKVIGELRNDDQHRRPFKAAYRTVDNGIATERRLEFRLITDQFHPAGGTIFRLSNEAINLYLNALDLDIEDAQAAAEAVVQSQLSRGKFDEATQSAKNARWQSLRYQEKISNILRETRRDITRVDWAMEVPRLLDEAIVHIHSRLTTEENILKTAKEHQSALSAGDDKFRALTNIIQLMQGCRLGHVMLQDPLMRARNVFLEEQSRQAFAPKPRRPYPNIQSDILEPALRLGRAAAERIAEISHPLFFGATPSPALSLVDLVSAQLRPRREQQVAETFVEETDPTTLDEELARYPQEIRDQAEASLTVLTAPTSLSALINDAYTKAAPAPVIEMLSLLALQHYDPEERTLPMAVEQLSGNLQARGFIGDELQLTPLQQKP